MALLFLFSLDLLMRFLVRTFLRAQRLNGGRHYRSISQTNFPNSCFGTAVIPA